MVVTVAELPPTVVQALREAREHLESGDESAFVLAAVELVHALDDAMAADADGPGNGPQRPAEPRTGDLTGERVPGTGTEALGAVLDLINDLVIVEGDDCRYDHHGFCQAHAWMAVEPACPHARAKVFLKAVNHG